MATRPKAVIESRNGEKLSPITIAKNVLTDDGQSLHDILSDRKEDMMTPTIENSSSMFKVGQGDDVDYSANVVNGAYESMVLKGKTMVNCIQESSSKDVVLPYEFADGQYVTINDTKESGALGVELKGQTLVNIHDKKTPTLAAAQNDWYSNLVIETNSISFTVAKLPENWRYISFKSLNLPMLKPNTKYLVAFEEASGVSTVTFKNGDSTHPLSDTVQIVNNKAIVTTTSNWVNSAQILFIYVPANKVGTEVKVKNPMIIEYVEGMENWNIPYFEGMTSCKTPILHTVGKNLFNINNPSYTWKSDGNLISTIEENKIKFLGYFSSFKEPYRYEFALKENTSYVFSYETFGNLGYEYPEDFCLRIYKDDTLSRTLWRMRGKVGFTLSNGENKVRFDIRLNKEWGEGEIYEIDGGVQNIQLEESSVKTSYENHKSSILSLPEEVILRSLPNGVCDTFNTTSGILTKKTQEVVLNGVNEKWTVDQGNVNIDTGNVWFKASLGEPVNHFPQGIVPSVADRFATHNINIFMNRTVVGICIENHIAEGELRLQMNIPQALIGGTSINDLKNYLKQNPVTIIVPSNAIATKINLSSTPKSWNTTTHIYSEISENTLYPILSHSNPSYPVILKPSTKYSIVANSYSNSHTNSAINFNLGGATASTTVGNRVTTITTPSTLSNELLTMSGRGNMLNNVMVIEGDVVGDEPYFEGICDCKSPILSNVGKNLFDKNNVMKDKYISAAGKETSEVGTNRNATDFIQVKPNTSYLLSGVQNSGVTNSNKQFYVAQYDANKEIIVVTTPSVSSDYVKITTEAKTKYIRTTIKDDDLDRCQIEQSTQATPHEPYKSNILSCNGDKIELTEDMFEQGGVYFTKGQSFANATNNTASDRIRLKTLLNLKPNTTYRIAIDNAHKVGVQLYNNEKLAVSDTGWVSDATFTTKDGEKSLALAIRKLSSTANISVSDFKNIKLQLSEVDKTIILRSLPNGVCDTLNVETGEYVQRIGELVVNGDNTVSYTAISTGAEKTIRVAIAHSSIKIVSNESVICAYCNNLGYKYNYQDDKDFESFFVANSNNRIFMRLAKSKLETLDIAGVKKYFSKNPYIFQYELAKPIVSTVDIQGFPHAYTNGHVQLSSGSIEQSLTPKVEYSVVTNRNGQIRSNQKMVERHQKQLDRLQAMILTNLVNTQYEQTLTNLKYDLKNVREEVK